MRYNIIIQELCAHTHTHHTHAWSISYDHPHLLSRRQQFAYKNMYTFVYCMSHTHTHTHTYIYKHNTHTLTCTHTCCVALTNTSLYFCRVSAKTSARNINYLTSWINTPQEATYIQPKASSYLLLTFFLHISCRIYSQSIIYTQRGIWKHQNSGDI